MVRSAAPARSRWPRKATTLRFAFRPAKSARCCSRALRRSVRSARSSTRTSRIGKAGRARWLGKRPHNRGVTMNPVDHPHGGGEGQSRVVDTRSPRGASRRVDTRPATIRVPTAKSSSGARRRRGYRHGTLNRKGPFIDKHLLTKVQAMNAQKKKVIRPGHAARRSAGVHRPHGRGSQWQEVHPGVRHGKHGRHKLGEFAPTRTFQGHSGEDGGEEVNGGTYFS